MKNRKWRWLPVSLLLTGSPVGDLFAEAADEGYQTNQAEGTPFRGYRFRILNGQGDSAQGGRKSYIVNGDMSGGFALIAYPILYPPAFDK